MKSAIAKRAVAFNGRKTSISLEDEFWESFRSIAKERRQTIGELIASVDADRQHSNLSSALRLFILDFYRAASKHVRAEFLDRAHVQ